MPHRAIVFNLFLPHPQPNVNLEFSAPTMPFIRIGAIATIHPKTSNIPFWSCLLCTPSLTLPPSSLKCLQKSNPNIHRKCFRCFKCFGCFRCFISLLDHKTARFWSKSEQTRKIGTHPPPSSNGYGKHPKKQSTLLSTNKIQPCVP